MKDRFFSLLTLSLLLAFFISSVQALFYDFEDEKQADDWQIFDGEGKIEEG